jgi:hypothetical protein
VREVNPNGETVWQIEKDDLPGYPLYTVQECSRLANGNTVICNWGGSIRKEDWDKVVQVIEVTPQKEVVWALHQWKDPDLGRRAASNCSTSRASQRMAITDGELMLSSSGYVQQSAPATRGE